MLVSATGWTLEYIDGMSMDRFNELADFYTEYPPANVTLSLVHLKHEKKRKVTREKDAIAQMTQAAGLLGQTAEAVPAHLREMAGWATEQAARLSKR